MAIRAVVFDLFDTLVDLRYEELPRLEHEGRPIPPTVAALHAAVCQRAEIDFGPFVEALLEVDRELRRTHTAEGIEVPSERRFGAFVERLGLEDPELPAVLTSLHMGMLRDTVSVPEHHGDLLARMGRCVRLGLCSNFTHSETALGILEEAGLAVHLDAVVISDAVGYRKPRQEIFRAALRALDVAPSEALHVGDNLRADIGGAGAVGMRTAWLTRRVGDPDARLEDHEGPPPDWQIGDLAELPSILEGEENP